ncbi:MAG: hypothetical protein RI996_527 [Candidatus Parcubacteria bacterium]|jgi:A/G-specific adenine glycosylase
MTTAAFQKLIWNYFEKNGRNELPWRQSTQLYHILVSEMMLQQTQVQRVIPKYTEWIQKFPNFKVLAQADFATVLQYWQGLGYARRAKFLHHIAYILQNKTDTECKELSIEELDALPGIGPYTARAIKTFTTETRQVFIETNIRTIFLYHFFHGQDNVSDKDILMLIEKTLPKSEYRNWYFALMDYGSYLKSIGIKNNNNSASYRKQSTFKGSNREARGAILKALLKHSKISKSKLQTIVAMDTKRFEIALEQLESEAFIKRSADTIVLK